MELEIFRERFWKNTQISNFVKIRPVAGGGGQSRSLKTYGQAGKT